MEHQTFNIHNEDDFRRITKGIKIAQCMRFKASIPESEKLVKLDDLVVSDSLSCTFCNTVFEDRDQQRLHYKLDWHRYNVKQIMQSLKPVNEDVFSLIADKDDVSSISGSESESDEDEASEKDKPNQNTKNGESSKTTPKSVKQLKKSKTLESDSTEDEDEELSEKKKTDALIVTASRHTKVFFENIDGHIFSIYRCLLHDKKDIPEQDGEMIAQALDSGRKKNWTVIMLGGGHFAAAVFLGGEAIVHKTFHCYTVRAKQGSSQNSRDNRSNGSRPKSAGASLRRYNENALVQHVQDILSSWTTHIGESSLILYRAVGPQNRTVLFGGKNPPLDKKDLRLRPLPFPTRRATFKEVQRVYDIVSSIEIYGPAINFADSFPISPRQPLRKKSSKLSVFDEVEVNAAINDNEVATASNSVNTQDNEKQENKLQSSAEKAKGSRPVIDRAKPRKSPNRPLPFDNVEESDQSELESETELTSCVINVHSNYNLNVENIEMNFYNNLDFHPDSTPKHLKNKENKQKKRKERKDKAKDYPVNEILSASKIKFWNACQAGDIELFDSTLQDLLAEVDKSEKIQNSTDNQQSSTFIPINMDDVTKLVNDSNEEGNTMLHIASAGDHVKVVWSLLNIGSDPCKKNKKLQTPYVITTDKKTRNTFRRFMGEFPDKFNYNKSQIPGPLTDELESEELEKRKQQKKIKREREKMRKKEQEQKKQNEVEREREKRAAAAERRMQLGSKVVRCIQCGTDVREQSSFEYNANKFCSMPCLKEHRAINKVALTS